MGKISIYMDHVELGKASGKILDYMAEADTTSSKIMNELESLKKTISIDGSRISNKSDLVDKSMRNIKNTNNSVLAVFNHVIDKYFASKDTIHALMDARIGALKNGKQ